MRVLKWLFGRRASDLPRSEHAEIVTLRLPARIQAAVPPDPLRTEVAETLTRLPCGTPPSQGWPVIVFLHGCGERAAAYAGHASLAAEHGFAGLVPSGPVATSHLGRSWSIDLAATDESVQGILALGKGALQVDRSRVYLCGFSQGATHTYGLLAAWPDRYRGAIVISPGEGPKPPSAPRAEPGPRPMYMAYGQGEYRQFRQRAQKWAARWRRAGHPCLIEPHAGGHHFPVDWVGRFHQIIGWLVLQSAEPGGRLGSLITAVEQGTTADGGRVDGVS